MLYLVGFLIVWIILISFKKNFFENNYVERHKKMQKEIKDYENYLKFCENKNEIPLSRVDFEVNILHSKEKKYKNLIK